MAASDYIRWNLTDDSLSTHCEMECEEWVCLGPSEIAEHQLFTHLNEHRSSPKKRHRRFADCHERGGAWIGAARAEVRRRACRD